MYFLIQYYKSKCHFFEIFLNIFKFSSKTFIEHDNKLFRNKRHKYTIYTVAIFNKMIYLSHYTALTANCTSTKPWERRIIYISLCTKHQNFYTALSNLLFYIANRQVRARSSMTRWRSLFIVVARPPKSWSSTSYPHTPKTERKHIAPKTSDFMCAHPCNTKDLARHNRQTHNRKYHNRCCHPDRPNRKMPQYVIH